MLTMQYILVQVNGSWTDGSEWKRYAWS